MVFVAKTKNESPVGSMAGWGWKRWLASVWHDLRNMITKPSFDSIFKPIAKILVSWMVSNGITDSVGAEVLITAAGTYVLNAIDYYFSEYN